VPPTPAATPAGVVIADQSTGEFRPLYKSGDDILTQFEGPIVEKVAC
jgi:DNA polymerase III alpha subunit